MGFSPHLTAYDFMAELYVCHGGEECRNHLDWMYPKIYPEMADLLRITKGYYENYCVVLITD